MSQITVGPPDIKTADPKILAIANYLRHNKILKQREGFLSGQRREFWRFKRAIRALESPEYKKQQKKNTNLPEISNRTEAANYLRQFAFSKFAFNVDKLETEEALSLGQKPAPGVPVLRISASQNFDDDEYFVWFYDPFKLSTYLYAGGAVVVIFALVLFPLWPVKLRIGVWYLSMGLLGFLGLFFALAVVRLIIFCISWLLSSRTFWLFPNLFEDVGVIESFQPFYAFSDQLKSLADERVAQIKKKKLKKQLKKEKRMKRQRSDVSNQQNVANANSSAPQQPVQSQQPPPNAIRVTLSPEQEKEASEVAEKIKLQMSALRQQIMNSPQAPRTPEQQQQMDQSLLQEMHRLIQTEIGKIAQRAYQEQQNSQKAQEGSKISEITEDDGLSTSKEEDSTARHRTNLNNTE